MITKILQYLGLKQKQPITEIEDLAKFIHCSASFVSQVVLITYIKARSGTQYPKLFENTEYLRSIDIARSKIYASSVADLIFYIIEEHFKDVIPVHQKNKNSKSLVEAIFKIAESEKIKLSKIFQAQEETFNQLKNLFSNFDNHKKFKMSSDAFCRWAPMAEEFKKEDEEIMRNSIHFRWIEIRREIRTRIQAEKINF